ncbi:MAG: hypothetical protein F4205_16900 [Gemmatimonadetes bacterium]|nr:hypothetical protein [Gemmatimonadota bacterium]MXX72574.1 hypothetical protein [Gemmatimonadota bacterium]MYC92983.1 hypothetical protein [Gemmatimonadota bacterium]MYG37155.1 hypothetical protein [Gemmatimonadota bacterium]
MINAVRLGTLLLWLPWTAACGGDDGGTGPSDDNQAPTAVGSIPAQTLTAGEVVTLDLASSFNDPDGDALTYSATTSNPAVASPTVSGSTLTIAGVSEGSAAVTVTATDPGGLTATQNVAVTVQRPNAAPTATGTVSPQVLEVGGEVSLNLADYFSDPDGDALAYAATSSSTAVAITRVAGSIMTITGRATGDATVTATATDPDGLSVSQMVMVTVQEPSMDREVLRTLFIHTNGAGWSNSSGWLTEAALGTWYGVTADDLDRVVQLELPDNRLRNSIPRELGELKQLIRLDLSENGMEGMIPRELGDLENLEFLDLSNSLFFARGTIPIELGNLKKLKWLDLSETNFFGRGVPIPSEFGNLESLERLDLRDADLDGKLPVQLGDLTKLKWLDISDNWFEGEIPREWMKLKLDYFHWKPIIDDIELCAPADEEFQKWLSSIADHEGGKTCGG